MVYYGDHGYGTFMYIQWYTMVITAMAHSCIYNFPPACRGYVYATWAQAYETRLYAMWVAVSTVAACGREVVLAAAAACHVPRLGMWVAVHNWCMGGGAPPRRLPASCNQNSAPSAQGHAGRKPVALLNSACVAGVHAPAKPVCGRHDVGTVGVMSMSLNCLRKQTQVGTVATPREGIEMN